MADSNNFDTLFEECTNYCMPVLKENALDVHQAKDAFLEAMTIYWLKKREKSIAHHGNIPALVCTIAIRLLKRMNEKTKRIHLIDNFSVSFQNLEVIEDILEDYYTITNNNNQKSEMLKKAFKKLGKKCQKLLITKYVYKHSYMEMVEDFGFSSLSAAKTATHRCMNKLKEAIFAKK